MKGFPFSRRITYETITLEHQRIHFEVISDCLSRQSSADDSGMNVMGYWQSGGRIMRKNLAKAGALAAAVLIMAGSASNVAFARHGHHSRKAVAQYAVCYQNGYCGESGICDVNGVCQNGGICTSTSYRSGHHSGRHH